MQTEQQYTGVRTPLPIDEFAEVLVRGHKDRAGFRSAPKHFDVRDAGIRLGNVRNVVPGFSKRFDDLALHALVAEERQAAPVEIG